MSATWDAIVVGGGPAGVTAALRLARAGLRVVVVEAAEYPGAENWSGAVYFTEVLADPSVLGPDELELAPFERRVVARGFFVTNGVAMAGFEYRNPEAFRNAYTVLRPVYDRYLAERAREFGAVWCTETAVDGLIRAGGRVVGVHTTRGPLYGDVVFLAEGDASELTSKEGYEPPSVRGRRVPQPRFLQGVKEVVALDPAAIEERFGVGPGEAACWEVLVRNGVVDGRPVRLNLAGFLYTNRSSVSVGIVVPLETLAQFGGDHAVLLEWFKAMPAVARLLDGGEPVSYGAKLIRSGGVRERPQWVDDGLAIGGAATGVGVDFPYPNFTGAATAMGRQFADAVLALRAEGAPPTRANLERAYARPFERSRYYRDAQHLADWPAYVESSEALFGASIDVCLAGAYVWTRPGAGAVRKFWHGVRAAGEALRGRWWRTVRDLVRGARALRLGRSLAWHLPLALPVWVLRTPVAPFRFARGPRPGDLRFRFWVEGEPAGRWPRVVRWAVSRWQPGLTRAARALYANDDLPMGAKLDRAVGAVLRQFSLWEPALAVALGAAALAARALQRAADALRLATGRRPRAACARNLAARWRERSRDVRDLHGLRQAAARGLDAKLGSITYASEPVSHIKVFFAPPAPGVPEDPARSPLWTVCPADVYRLDLDASAHPAVAVNHENCVKCESCWRATPEHVDWSRFAGHRLTYEVYTDADEPLLRALDRRTGAPGPAVDGDVWSAVVDALPPPPAAPEDADARARLASAWAAVEAALARVDAKVAEMGAALRGGPRVLEPGQVEWLQGVADYLAALAAEVTEAFTEPALHEWLAAAGWHDAVVPILDDLERVARRVRAHAAARRFFFADADARQIRDHHVVGLRRIARRAAEAAGLADATVSGAPAAPAPRFAAAHPSAIPQAVAGAAAADPAARAAEVRARLAETFEPEALRRLDRGGEWRDDEVRLWREIAGALGTEGNWAGADRLLVLEEMARLDPALAWLLSGHLAAVNALERAGAPPDVLHPFRRADRVLALAFESPVERRDDRWAGRVPFVAAARADAFVLRSAGQLGLVPRDAPGLRLEPVRPVGLVACGIAELALSDARPEWAGPWRAPADAALFGLRARDLAAIAAGAADLLAERAVEHARQRVQFPDHFQDLEGRDAVAKFGAVREHLARIEWDRRVIRACLEDAAWGVDPIAAGAAGDPSMLEPKLAKWAVTRALGPERTGCTYAAGQVVGGSAYSEDDIFSKLYRDSAVFPHCVRPNQEIALEVGRVVAALVRDGRALGPVASGVEPALRAARRRPLLGSWVERLRRAQETLATVVGPTLTGLGADDPVREAVHAALGEVVLGLFVWERLLARAHRCLDAGADAETWVEAACWAGEQVEERLVELGDELAWLPVRVGLGVHALSLGDYPDAPLHSRVEFSYADTIVGGRRAYVSGASLRAPVDLETPRYLPEHTWLDPALRRRTDACRAAFRTRFALRTFDGRPYERYVERLHAIPAEDIAWLRDRGAFRTVIPEAYGGAGLWKADYYALCMLAKRFADVSVTLTIQVNTSIGTTPILLALEQEIPAAERECREALERPEAVAAVRARLERVREAVDAGAHDRADREWSRLREEAGAALGRGRVLRKALFGPVWDALDRAERAWRLGDRAGARLALEEAVVALDGWADRARAELAELPLRRLALETGLRRIAAGEISGFALTEPSAGSDTARIRTDARPVVRTLHADPDGVRFFYLDESRREGRRNVGDLRRLVVQNGRMLYRYRDDAPPAELAWEPGAPGRPPVRRYRHDGRTVELHDLAIPRERDGREVVEFYEVNGAKMWITNGHIASVLCLYARTPAGPTGFLLDVRGEGVQVGKDEEKMGQRGSPTNEITLTRARVPRECVLGVEGRGQENALETLNVGRAGLGVLSAAFLQQMVADARAAARETGAGESGWARAALGFAVEEMFAVESVAHELVGRFDDPTTRSLRMESAIAKMFGSEAVHRALDALEPLYGLAGQTDRYRIEKDRRDARVLTIYEGTNEVQRFLLLRELVEAVAPAWTAPPEGVPPANSAFADEVAWLNEMKHELRARLERVRTTYGSAAWRRVLFQPVFFRLADMAAWIVVAESAVARAHWVDTHLGSPADAGYREWTGMAGGGFAARARREFRRLAFAFDRDVEILLAGGRPTPLRLAELVLDAADRRDLERRFAPAAPVRVRRCERAAQVVVVAESAPRIAPRPRLRGGRPAEHVETLGPGARRALRWALELKRAAPDRVTVTVACAGPRRAEPWLRRALAAGADAAVLFDVGAGASERAVASALARWLGRRGPAADLVLVGADGTAPSDGRLAARLAAEMERPWVADACALEWEVGAGGAAVARVAVTEAGDALALAGPLAVVAVAGADGEPAPEFDTAGFQRAVAAGIELVPVPAEPASAETWTPPAAPATRAETPGAGAWSPERAAEFALELLGARGDPQAAPYAGPLARWRADALRSEAAVLACAAVEPDGARLDDRAANAGAALAAAWGLPLELLVLGPALDDRALRRVLGPAAARGAARRIAYAGDPGLATGSPVATLHALDAILRGPDATPLRALVVPARLAEPVAALAQRWGALGTPPEEVYGVERVVARDGTLALARRAFGGRLLATRALGARETSTRLWIVGCAADVQVEGPATRRANTAVGRVEWTLDDARRAADPYRTVRRGAGRPVTLATAEVVIDVGAGVGTGENLERIAGPLRDALLAAGAPHVEIGGSRKVTEDLGLLPRDRQIGQTGVRVNPRICIALGISGAPQHLDYVGERAVIFAFNLDPHAPIMTLNARRERPVVVPVVGDLFETVPRFVEALRRATGRRAA